MNKFILVFLISFFTILINAQPNYFSGEIEYSHSYQDATDEVLINLQEFMGTKSKMMFKNGFMFTSFDSKSISKDFYDPETKRSYTIYLNNDTIYYADQNYMPEELIEINECDIEIEVLGYKCKCLEVKKRNIKNNVAFSIVFYYNLDATPINPIWFDGVTYGNYEDIYGKMASIPLKVIFKYDFATVCLTATKLRKKELELKKLIQSEIKNSILKPQDL